MLTYYNLKFTVTFKNAVFERLYTRTHTKEKPFKNSDITFAIWPFYQHTQTDWPCRVFWNLLLLMKLSDALQHGNYNIKITKCEVGYSHVCNLHATYSSVLYGTICSLLERNLVPVSDNQQIMLNQTQFSTPITFNDIIFDTLL